MVVAGIKAANERAVLRADKTGNTESNTVAGICAIGLVAHIFTGHAEDDADALGDGGLLWAVLLAVDGDFHIAEGNGGADGGGAIRLHINPQMGIAAVDSALCIDDYRAVCQRNAAAESLAITQLNAVCITCAQGYISHA